eukprot:gnl/MRDRNA2_/MRDRNA2_131516_c0_seq1.p1 gnl/MRDRNA2_/MRDRNA2_131516_c0~~gnl/MRDRNA2_/MRDRNA2_131516_c0_seq1.p1  ORF type:complete len:448 (-),score=21.36 gnl/MRDRNA2_/MRDRNA2_131516_c0_seq1:78-1394(-)
MQPSLPKDGSYVTPYVRVCGSRFCYKVHETRTCLLSVSSSNVQHALLIAGLVALFCALCRYSYRSHKADDGSTASNNGTQRSAVLDNSKFFCIVMIVGTHYNMFISGSDIYWGCDTFLKLNCRLALSGFSFVSGTVSKGSPTWSRLQSLLLSVLLPFLLYTLIFDVIIMPWVVGKPVSINFLLGQIMSASPNITWYLQSLIVWRLLAWFSCLVANGLGTEIWPCFAIVTLVLFVASSFIPMHVWSLDNGVAYLPCFALGFLFPIEEFIAAANMMPHRVAAGFSFLGIWGFVSQRLPRFWEKDLYEHLTGRYPCISVLSWCEGMSGALLYAIEFIILLGLLCPRQEQWFTKIGRDSIYVYLLHMIVFKLFLQANLQEHHIWDSHVFRDLAAIVIPLTVTVFLSWSPVKLLFSWIIEPRQSYNRAWHYSRAAMGKQNSVQ